LENREKFKVVLVGAGFISGIHAEALKQNKKIEIVAIVDFNIELATSLANKFKVPHVFEDINKAINTIEFDVAHVLVPPNYHYDLCKILLNANKNILVEKPISETVEEAEELITLAKEKNCLLAVNQNFIFHPAFIKAKRLIKQGTIGQIKSIHLTYEMPLRQLDLGLFSHWMFRQPVNILLEQAVHPVSQLFSLIGQPQNEIKCLSSTPKYLLDRLPFTSRVDIIGKAKVPFHLSFAMGQEYPVWQFKIIGVDGIINVDMPTNKVVCSTKSRFLPALDVATTSLFEGGTIIKQGIKELLGYSTAISGISRRKDTFYLGMLESFNAYYNALSNGSVPEHNATFGRDIIKFCHKIANEGFQPSETKETPITNITEEYDVLVIGGSGFIGKKVVKQLLDANFSIGVMARNINALPAFFYHEKISLLQGNVRNKKDVEKAVINAKFVINLAHGGGGGSWEDIKAAMVGSAKLVADACKESNIERLVHVSSIASLYLGDNKETITAKTTVDKKSEFRADYSRAKAVADEMLLKEYSGLDLVLLRPGIVVGEGGLVNHTGIGFFNNSQHFIGWNMGNNPLPFVLVEDVASGIISSLTAKNITGQAFNLVGDVTPSAREFVELMSERLERPFKFHPQPTRWLYSQEFGKWLIKKISGRKVASPKMRDFLSRGMLAKFDNSIEKERLNWSPVSDNQEFAKRAIDVHK